MNKVVNDPVIQKLTELKSIMPVKGDKFNLNEVLGKDYEPIEENVYRCKKYYFLNFIYFVDLKKMDFNLLN